jgi:outer membrane protein
MKKLPLFTILFSIILMPFGVIAADYSLNDLYSIALERSEAIKIAEEELYISEREKNMARSVLMPTISAFGNHTRYSEEKRQSSFLLQPDYNNEWGVRLDQSFSLSGRELTAFKIAKEGIKKSGYDLKAVREAHIFEVAAGYYTVLAENKGLEIAAANEQRLTKHRDAAKKRLEAGVAIKTVLLRAEAELAGAQSDLIRAGNSLKIAKTRLARRAGLNGDFDIKEPVQGKELDLGLLVGECGLAVIDCLKEAALSERAEIRSMSVQKDTAEDKVKFAKGAYWPSLSVEGVYIREENEPASTFGLDERIYGVLRLDFPFFEGGLRRAEVGAARARLRQTEYGLSELRRQINVEVENSYLIFITQGAVLNRLRAEVEYALDNFNAVTKQFRHGLADSIDVIDANTLLATSQRELANSEYLYQLAFIRMQRSIGTLLTSVLSGQ